MQKELFEDFKEPVSKHKKSPGILPRNFLAFNITYDQIIYAAIGVIMLMALVFSLGVEKGRSISSGAVKAGDAAAGSRPAAKPDETPKEPQAKKAAQEAVTTKALPEKNAPAAPEQTISKAAAKLFTIQLVAYKSKRSAQEEMDKLIKKGYKPFIIVERNMYQICVGEYAAKEEAKKGLALLSKTYKGSFVRER